MTLCKKETFTQTFLEMELSADDVCEKRFAYNLASVAVTGFFQVLKI